MQISDPNKIIQLENSKKSENSKQILKNDQHFELNDNELSKADDQISENNFDSKQKKSFNTKLGLEDFDIIQSLGNGSFGEVSLIKKKGTEQLYAMKAINKNFLFKVKRNKINNNI